MKRSDLLSVVEDLRLNSDAVRVVLFVAARGPGKHEIPKEEFSVLLNQAGDRKIAQALRLAVQAGWLDRSKGGWGSPDSFEFMEATVPAKNAVTGNGTVPAENADTQGVLFLPNSQSQGPVTDKNAVTTRTREIRKRERVVVVDEEGREVAFPIDEKVKEELAKDLWSGFRSSVTDYLGNRVETSRQWGWVMTLKTWFRGGLGSPKGFCSLMPTEQVDLLATAVNELLSQTPTQERLNYRSSRGISGEITVLRNKVEYHIRRNERGPFAPDKNEKKQTDSIGDLAVRFPEDR